MIIYPRYVAQMWVGGAQERGANVLELTPFESQAPLVCATVLAEGSFSNISIGGNVGIG